MASKNNPNVRNKMKLFVYCPNCGEMMTLIKVVPEKKMYYICGKNPEHRVRHYKHIYKELKHEWAEK